MSSVVRSEPDPTPGSAGRTDHRHANQMVARLKLKQVLGRAIHQRILLRAAELVATGWTRRTAARGADGQKLRSTSPQAAAWCAVGAMDRALYELVNLDVYELLGLEVDAMTRRRAR